MSVNTIKYQVMKASLDTQGGSVISISGPWGIGKTHFWRKFMEENNKDLRIQRYSYVSLFGIDSLDNLKFSIASEVSSNTFVDNLKSRKFEIPIWIKKLTHNLSTVNLKGVNISGGLLSKFLFEQVEDSIICIDDFERLSEKLKIKDVMGLVNYLKDRKNCKVVLILHELKADKSFQEYKEKIIDEYISIDNCREVVESIGEHRSSLIADDFKSFYDVFDVKNLRFYSKVMRLFLQIESKLPREITDFSLSEILKSLFIFQLVIELKDFQLEKSDLDQLSREYMLSQINETEEKSDIDLLREDVIKKIHDFYGYFTMGEWQNAVFNILYKHEELNVSAIDDLIQKDVLSETHIKNQAKLKALVSQFYNFEFDESFSNDLAVAAKANIHNENLLNLSWYCQILEELGQYDLAKSIEDEVKNNLNNKISSTDGRGSLDDYFPFERGEECRFRPYVQDCLNGAKSKITLYAVMSRYYEERSFNPDLDRAVLDSSTKEDWRKLIWDEVKTDRSRFIGIVLRERISSPEKHIEIHKWILEILHEKSLESKELGLAINHWLSIKDK